MTSPSDSFEELSELSAAVREDRCTPQQVARLNARLIDDPSACDIYARYVLLEAMLEFELGAGRRPAEPSSRFHAPILSLLSTAYHGTVGFFTQEIPFALLVATVLTCLGLWGASLVYVSRPEQIVQSGSPSSPSETQTSVDPTLEVVGRITAMVGCRWSKDGRVPSGYDNILVGRQFKLDAGLMEITYTTGAKVVLQGPVTYEVAAKNGGYLSVGKLTGKVEVEAAKGFVVRTPIATVTDLGTEFGVEVRKSGVTTAHVFRGVVRLQVVSSNGRADGAEEVLHENQSARVEKSIDKRGEGNHVTVFVTLAKPTHFVRSISKPLIKMLDLVDVVSGGDGFSGRRNRGIEANTGKPTDTPPPLTASGFVGDAQYHRTEGLPFVDGVFIPNGDAGSVQIDSAGDTFADFGRTSNSTAGHIWAGGVLPGEDQRKWFQVPAKLGGIDFSAPNHTVLGMHANKGITFDLEAIRRVDPGWKITGFRAMAGNTGVAGAELWVLVDGHLRFRRRDVTVSNGAFPAIIPICDSERFLTLAATDGGRGIPCCWTMFGDPQLELLSYSGNQDQ